MKILLSKKRLEDLDTFESTESHMVEVVDGYNGLQQYLSFQAHERGYPSMEKYLEREKFYMYNLSEGKRVKVRSLN